MLPACGSRGAAARRAGACAFALVGGGGRHRGTDGGRGRRNPRRDEARVVEYCRRLGCAPVPVRLTSARTRWGSCSARSGIRLHWRLIHVAPGLLDYVVAHEVAHLAEMNHSPRFWRIVEALYPDWRE